MKLQGSTQQQTYFLSNIQITGPIFINCFIYRHIYTLIWILILLRVRCICSI